MCSGSDETSSCRKAAESTEGMDSVADVEDDDLGVRKALPAEARPEADSQAYSHSNPQAGVEPRDVTALPLRQGSRAPKGLVRLDEALRKVRNLQPLRLARSVLVGGLLAHPLLVDGLEGGKALAPRDPPRGHRGLRDR